MKDKRLEESFEKIISYFEEVEERREELLKSVREILMLCSKAIFDLHAERFKDARGKILRAKHRLFELKGIATNELKKYLVPAETELVEVYVLEAIINNKEIPSIDELKVSEIAYAMGILDCIGELKRRLYELIRLGKSKEANETFSIMERLYSLSFPLASYDKVASGIRRKVDVARNTLELARAAVAEEIRRANLIKSIESLKRLNKSE
jgi:translin